MDFKVFSLFRDVFSVKPKALIGLIHSRFYCHHATLLGALRDDIKNGCVADYGALQRQETTLHKHSYNQVII